MTALPKVVRSFCFYSPNFCRIKCAIRHFFEDFPYYFPNKLQLLEKTLYLCNRKNYSTILQIYLLKDNYTQKMKHFFLSLIVLFAFVAEVTAQEYAVELEANKKTVYVKLLGLPESTTIQEVLNILPEMLSRPGTFLVSNYVIKIEGMCVDNASDAVTKQLRIADVEKIVVEESPIDTYNHQGEGGSINIILTDSDCGLSGNVSLDGCYPTDIVPGLHLNYKKGDWRIHGLAKGEYYDPTVLDFDVNQPKDIGTQDYSYTKNNRFWGQFARIYASRNTDKSLIELAAGEENSSSRELFEGGQNKLETKDVFTFLGHAKWEYNLTKKSKMMVRGDYNFTPTKEKKDGKLMADTKVNSVSSQAEYTFTVFSNEKSNLVLHAGSNFNFDWTNISLNQNIERTTHIMPYVKVESKLGRWLLLGEAEYQNFKYSLLDKDDKDVSPLDISVHHDFTGAFVVGYQLTDHQFLRFTADEKIQRQNSLTLEPIKHNELKLDYIINHYSDVDSWLVNVGTGYIHVGDIFATKENPCEKNKILFANAMASYQRGIFSIALTGNLYSCGEHFQDNSSSTYTYFNASVLPSINLRNGLHCAVHYVHNGVVDQYVQRKGACNYLRMIVSKDFGNWNVHAYGQINLHGKTKDISYNFGDSGYTSLGISTSHELVRNAVGVGFRYSF